MTLHCTSRSAALTAGLSLLLGCNPATDDTGRATATTTAEPTTAASTTDPSGAATTDPPTTAVPTTEPTTGVSASATGTTGAPDTTATADATTGSTGPASTTASTSDTDFVCDPNAVPDTLKFNYVKTVDIGLGDIQASYYNIEAQEMVFLAYHGAGKRVALDGTVLGDVEAPVEVSNLLDGATYDQVNKTALLVDQACNFAEVDPVTLAPISITKLDAKFGLSVCSGLAVGLDGHLWLTSTNTDEVVAITRDLTTEVARYKVDGFGLTNVDGISLIAGSENFLVLSTFDLKAAILTPGGGLIVPASTIGGAMPPLVGGDTPAIPDAVLTVCGNGHAWICEGLVQNKVGCYEYAPEGGGGDSCPCVIPG